MSLNYKCGDQTARMDFQSSFMEYFKARSFYTEIPCLKVCNQFVVLPGSNSLSLSLSLSLSYFKNVVMKQRICILYGSLTLGGFMVTETRYTATELTVLRDITFS